MSSSYGKLQCYFNKSPNIIPIIRTNYDSSVEVRVLCKGGLRGEGLSSSLIGQKCKMADGKQPSDWTIIQDGRWNRTRLNKMKFSDWQKFKFKFSLM